MHLSHAIYESALISGRIWSAQAHLVGTNKANLKTAIAGETYEAATMCPDFAAQAAAAGDRAAARKFWKAGRQENSHAHAFAAALRRR